jgi:hypothetical protein
MMVGISLLKLYSKEVAGLGPGHLQRVNGVTVTHQGDRNGNPSTTLN